MPKIQHNHPAAIASRAADIATFETARAFRPARTHIDSCLLAYLGNRASSPWDRLAQIRAALVDIESEAAGCIAELEQLGRVL